jgi:hypothetical protein
VTDARYYRHNLIDWFSQEAIAKTKVAVIGAGAVGNEVMTRECGHSSQGWGVVKSLELIGSGPVGLVHRQKVHFFSEEKPASVVESYKKTHRHKLI